MALTKYHNYDCNNPRNAIQYTPDDLEAMRAADKEIDVEFSREINASRQAPPKLISPEQLAAYRLKRLEKRRIEEYERYWRNRDEILARRRARKAELRLARLEQEREHEPNQSD